MKEKDLIEGLNSKLRGHYQFYGVIGNSAALSAMYHGVRKLLFKWLNRRSQKKSMNWSTFTRRLHGKLVKPRVTEQRALQRNLFGPQR